MIRRYCKEVDRYTGDIKGEKGMTRAIFYRVIFCCFFLSACSPPEPVSTALVILPTETWTLTPPPTHAPPTLTETPIPVTPQPTLRPSATPTATLLPGYVRYETQSGDTLEVVAARFGTTVEALLCAETTRLCPEESMSGLLIPAGVELLIPDRVRDTDAWILSPGNRILPDSEFVFSVKALDLDLAVYLENTAGFLKSHRQYLMVNGWNSGADLVQMVALENSVNPHLLLALLEYQCRCVLDNPGPVEKIEPFLKITSEQYFRKDLWGQLDMAVNRLWVGYSGWRAGTLTEFLLKDGTVVRPSPALNAGTVAVQYFFAGVYGLEDWQATLDVDTGFPALFETMFGDPWQRAVDIFPADAAQPAFILPFERGTTWSYTGGPHPSFDGNGPLASLDFAPALAEPGCWQTDAWVLAVADGVVVRVDPGLVMLDLDGDGLEQTGWNVMYLHIEARDRVQVGTVLKAGARIGHPSCEGGVASGTHVHMARKFNGEWIAADSPLPFNLGGWVAYNGERPYLGTLVRGEEVLIACTCSWEKGWVVVRE
jgi:LasA protease